MKGDRKNQLNMGFGRRLGVVYQDEVADCGLACLAMVANYYGSGVSLSSMRNRFGSTTRGVTLAAMSGYAARIGLQSRALRADVSQLRKLRTPAILHWDHSHFVVLRNTGRRHVVIHDPARGVVRVKWSELARSYSGIAMELFPNHDFEAGRREGGLSLSGLLSNVNGLTFTFIQVLVVALVLEGMGVVIPFYMQWVTDHVILNQDHHLMTVLGIAFVSIVIFQAAFGVCRSWLIMWAGANLNIQWSSNFFSRLMHLPLEWFERRHIGDIVSRLGASQTIQKTLTSQFVGSVIDGMMSMTTLFIMGFYSIRLLGVSISVLILYVVLRAAFFRPLKRANEAQILEGARLQTEILECLKGVVPIKLANQQASRSSKYIGTATSVANADLATQKISSIFSILSQCIQGLGRVVLVWLAAIQVMDGEITLGMVVAFASFSDQFVTRGAALVDKFVDLKMLSVHLSRLSDIALAALEPGYDNTWDGPDPEAGISVRSLGFRYSEGSPWIMKDVSFDIRPGESVAIVGRSGCGKTTLVKILAGLISPTEGTVYYGGVPIQNLGMDRYRDLMAAVMQDDSLVSGTLEENIVFGKQGVDRDRLYDAAKRALIHDDILAMPMGYQTVVGNMGAALSGGQKQRVMLARALYRSPRLLLLDEATSNLDVQSEALVSESIRSLNVTRVMIAHRQETVRTADRVIDLSSTGEELEARQDMALQL